MCRVYGYINRDVPPTRLAHTGALLHHGGPDGHFLDHGPGWALGATRLAVMAPRHGAQPYALGPIRVVFNGEIYNHRELRERLARHGYPIDDPCDGAVLPALYHRYGTSFADHLDGMYAIAVMDLRGEPRLVLATDDTGVKPLYYHRDRHGGVSFASEIAALRYLSGAGARHAPDALDTFLTTKTPLGTRCVYEDITALEPARTVTVTARGRMRWHPRAPAAPSPGPDAAGPERAAGAVRDLLRTEVHRLAVADVPVAAVLSGGLDSSLVTGLLTEVVDDLHAFHIRYRGSWPADESTHARAVATARGVRLHEVELDPAHIPDLLPKVLRHLGQPNADPITVSTYALFEAVRDAGFTVALTGDAADELFGGYARVTEGVSAQGDWGAEYVRALAAVPSPLRTRLYRPDYRDLLREIHTAEEELLERVRGREGDRLAAMTDVEIGLRMPAYHLRRVDHLSMASAIEVRPPFCQRSLVAAARRLPASLKVHRGQGKRVLHAAARGVVPERVRNRPKQPFTLPITAMLAPGTALFAHAQEVLAPAELRTGGALDPGGVTALLRRQALAPDAGSALAIWSLMVFELWRRQESEPVPAPRPREQVA
ncbi:asparagine synthase (glutamine-hydrolyzing) [Streptomyces sp. NBRC 110028]|uniref:asparagine synthase (glutamine-hydrolyzing) n=1 Tax=Streptomyces sp. NBRC 110028 TaxID=1621260 RepID=UPI0006E229EC|nr:asparagine synthase (glutamine-hydrolyzing) [Streptomyces sp. NBRC 110028]